MNKKNISFPKKLSLKRILLLLFLLYLAALTVPYIPHKKVSDSFRKSFSERTFYSDTIGTERVAYIADNEEALLYRLRMIGEADKEIILSTFDFNSDRAGKEILAALLHAADRGVSVRIIADGISGFLDLRGDPWFQAAASHENNSCMRRRIPRTPPCMNFWIILNISGTLRKAMIIPAGKRRTK